MTKRTTVTPQELENIRGRRPETATLNASAAGSSMVRLLSTIDRKLVASLMQDVRYEAGEIIFHEGDAGDAMYLIWSGMTAVVKGDFRSPKALFYRMPGEMVGDMAVLEGKPRWASLVAIENTRMLRIERENFVQLLHAEPGISLDLLALLSARLRQVNNQNLAASDPVDQHLLRQLSTLINENEQLLELQRVRQETSDLIVHDLRSPLNNMFSALHMMELVLPEDVLDANRELLNIAKLAHLRMQNLVDSLLDVSLLESGDISLNLESVNLAQIIEEVLSLAALGLEERKVGFDVQLEAGLPWVMADEDRIRRVMTNLVDNAVKYSPRQSVIRIEVGRQNAEVLFSVQDQGVGIPEAERRRIFERFTRVHGGGARPRGFGLGLAFCRLAVEAHHGRIWVETGANNIGSRFVFTLPISSQ
jgi:signal transduction histidine kinase